MKTGSSILKLTNVTVSDRRSIEGSIEAKDPKHPVTMFISARRKVRVNLDHVMHMTEVTYRSNAEESFTLTRIVFAGNTDMLVEESIDKIDKMLK